jgi:hypothetical protein
MPKVLIECETCRQTFPVWPYRLQKGVRYCSQECRVVAMRGLTAQNRSQLSGRRFGRLTALTRIASVNGHALWRCQCDCGSTTEVRAGNLASGAVKSCGCLNRRRGQAHPNWRRGYTLCVNGYKHLLKTDGSSAKRYEPEHRIVMAAIVGRPLRSDEVVHHINHVKTDNRPVNLALLTRAEHAALHAAAARRTTELSQVNDGVNRKKPSFLEEINT